MGLPAARRQSPSVLYAADCAAKSSGGEAWMTARTSASASAELLQARQALGLGQPRLACLDRIAGRRGEDPVEFGDRLRVLAPPGEDAGAEDRRAVGTAGQSGHLGGRPLGRGVIPLLELEPCQALERRGDVSALGVGLQEGLQQPDGLRDTFGIGQRQVRERLGLVELRGLQDERFVLRLGRGLLVQLGRLGQRHLPTRETPPGSCSGAGRRSESSRSGRSAPSDPSPRAG